MEAGAKSACIRAEVASASLSYSGTNSLAIAGGAAYSTVL